MKFCPNFVLQVTNTGRELEAKLSGLDVYFQQLARCFVFVCFAGWKFRGFIWVAGCSTRGGAAGMEVGQETMCRAREDCGTGRTATG